MAISKHGYRYSCETQLHEGIARALEAAGLSYRYEHSLSPQDRPDFLLEGGIAIEVKISGTLPTVTRQVHRYAKHDEVKGVVLVTSRAKHMRLPLEMRGKPVRAVFVGRI